ncbi:MAG: hypothetical protein K2H31_11575, partial [Lachnospiraceae bacterium]|nr:hypothetical protein [Lachnospiraceae bacterium]
LIIWLIISSQKELEKITDIENTFRGNNGYGSYYSDSIGNKGYGDIESALEDEIWNRDKKSFFSNLNELEEIYRIQIGEKIFVYFKENEQQHVFGFEVCKQDDLYYCRGGNCLLYDGLGKNYATEDTIRRDIVYNTLRGNGWDKIEAPAWGVSDDELIFSMSVNSEKVDDVKEAKIEFF